MVHRLRSQDVRVSVWSLCGIISLFLALPGLCLLVSAHRRSTKHIVCNTTASDEGFEKVKVSVRVDKAKIHQELQYEYVEDPTILRIEPEWSIFRWASHGPSASSHGFLMQPQCARLRPWYRKVLSKHYTHWEIDLCRTPSKSPRPQGLMSFLLGSLKAQQCVVHSLYHLGCSMCVCAHLYPRKKFPQSLVKDGQEQCPFFQTNSV